MSCATKADLLQELRRPSSVAAQGGNAVSNSDICNDKTDSQNAPAGKAEHDRGHFSVEDVKPAGVLLMSP